MTIGPLYREFETPEELGEYLNSLHGKSHAFEIKHFTDDKWWHSLNSDAERVREKMLAGKWKGRIRVPVKEAKRDKRQEAVEHFGDILRGANEAFNNTLKQAASDCRTVRLNMLAIYQRQAIVAGSLLNALQDGKSFAFCREVCTRQGLREYKNGHPELAEEWLNWETHPILFTPNDE